MVNHNGKQYIKIYLKDYIYIWTTELLCYTAEINKRVKIVEYYHQRYGRIKTLKISPVHVTKRE